MATPQRTTAPAFQFYPKDFLTSPKVRKMSLTERGAYITLLSLCWLDGSLPADPGELAVELRVSPTQFRRMWSGVLSQCFTEKHGRLTNDRLEEERRKQAEFRRRQSDNGKQGGRPKKPTDNPPVTISKAVGFSGETQTEPKKSSSSPISYLQSPSPEKKKEDGRLDVAFVTFRDAYPAARRKGGWNVQTGFVEQVQKCEQGVAGLMAALENHKASEQWQNPKLIPGMDTWLEEERWRQRLDPPGVSELPSVSVSKLPAWVQRAQAMKAKAVQS